MANALMLYEYPPQKSPETVVKTLKIEKWRRPNDKYQDFSQAALFAIQEAFARSHGTIEEIHVLTLVQRFTSGTTDSERINPRPFLNYFWELKLIQYYLNHNVNAYPTEDDDFITPSLEDFTFFKALEAIPFNTSVDQATEIFNQEMHQLNNYFKGAGIPDAAIDAFTKRAQLMKPLFAEFYTQCKNPELTFLYISQAVRHIYRIFNDSIPNLIQFKAIVSLNLLHYLKEILTYHQEAFQKKLTSFKDPINPVIQAAEAHGRAIWLKIDQQLESRWNAHRPTLSRQISPELILEEIAEFLWLNEN